MAMVNGYTAEVAGDQTIGTAFNVTYYQQSGPTMVSCVPLTIDPTDTIPGGKGLLVIQIGGMFYTQLMCYVE